mmetsp:Transcript_24620/g.30278  ORF Transcript_24620/g.30278 Transcript_24620/m.30278 type:complete len:154 (-) Transcript_24620:496-957(-)
MSFNFKKCGHCGLVINEDNIFSRRCSTCHIFFNLHPACAVKLVNTLPHQQYLVQTRGKNNNLTSNEFNCYNVSLRCCDCKTKSCFECPATVHNEQPSHRSVICGSCRNTWCYMLPYVASGASSTTPQIVQQLRLTQLCARNVKRKVKLFLRHY